MGEEKWRCINVGYSAINNINLSKFNYEKIKLDFNLSSNKPLVMFTMHPLVLKNKLFLKELNESFKCIEKLVKLEYQIIITYPNFDPGFELIINKIKKIKLKYKNIKIYKHLGRLNYHKILYFIGKSKNGACVGNSSSGIKEAIIFNSPSINIGDRQKSRLKPDNVIDVKADCKKIIKTIKENLYVKTKRIQNPYKLTKEFYGIDKKIIKLIKNKNFYNKKCTY